jgi:hypothetical protein
VRTCNTSVMSPPEYLVSFVRNPVTPRDEYEIGVAFRRTLFKWALATIRCGQVAGGQESGTVLDLGGI